MRARLDLLRWGLVTLIVVELVAAVPILIFSERPALRYLNVPFPVLNSPVPPGDVIDLAVERCYDGSEPEPYIVTRTLISLDRDSPNVTLPSTGTTIEPGCDHLASGLHAVPPNVRPGHYYLRGVSTISGTFRNFSVAWRSADFEVRPRE